MAHSAFFVFGVLFCLVLHEDSIHAAVAGPYTITVRELGTCPQTEYETDDDLTIDGLLHYNRTNKAELIFTGHYVIKNDVATRGATKVTLDFAKWNSVSGWREHFLVMPVGEGCSLVDDIGRDVVEILSQTVEGQPNKCPVPNRIYNVTNTPARVGQLRHFPVLPYGRFRVHALGYHFKKPTVKKPRLCARLVLDLDPKVARPAT